MMAHQGVTLEQNFLLVSRNVVASVVCYMLLRTEFFVASISVLIGTATLGTSVSGGQRKMAQLL